MKKCFVCVILCASTTLAQAGEYLGQLSVNPYAAHSTSGVAANVSDLDI